MKKILFSVVVFVLVNFVANGQWSNDPSVGTAVSTGSPTTAKSNNVSTNDGGDGSFIAWTDSRVSANQSVYIQRLLSNGTRKFASDLLVTGIANVSGGTSSAKTNLTIVADGSGGAILLWLDARNTTSGNTNNDIYGQRVDGDGNLLWAADGVRLTVANNTISNKTTPAMDRISSTEVMLVFGDNRTASQVDLYAQKIAISNGATQWVNDVSVMGQQTGTPTFQSLLADGAGGAYIVSQDQRNGTSNIDIYGQRLDNSGAPLWGASGVGIATRTSSNQTQPTFTVDGANGIVVVYGDFLINGGTDPSIYAQRVDPGGALQWGANGVVVCTAPLIQSNPYVIKSGSNYIVAWSDQRDGVGLRDIYAQSLNLAGALQWTPPSTVQTDGIAITKAANNQPSSAANIVLLPDASGGAFIIWDDARNSAATADIYTQKINSAGVVQLATDGYPVSTAANAQTTPVAVLTPSFTVIINWRDGRSVANGEIYAARLLSDGTLPVRSININALVKNASIDVKWTTVDESNTDFFIIEKSSDGARYSSIGSVKAKGTGNGVYLLNDVTPVKGANYYRIKATDKNGASYYSSIALVQYDKEGKAVLVVYPNPVQQLATLQLANVAKGNYQLRVYDLSGRAVLQQRVTVAAGIPNDTY
jgi:hypothetical protein